MIKHEEHPDWRDNWRPWLRAKAIKTSGGASLNDNENDYEQDEDRPERSERRYRHRRQTHSDDFDDAYEGDAFDKEHDGEKEEEHDVEAKSSSGNGYRRGSIYH